jgi:polyhydroxyalkanoate synthesis repressor PhaR
MNAQVSEAPSTANGKRVIKKYPNRRLYDTALSKYITLDDVRQLVLDSTEFVVQDAKTGEDITRSILLHVIIEQEAGDAPVFTTDVLTQIIRFYGDAVQGMAGMFLERSLHLFTEQQRSFQEQVSKNMVNTPFAALTELTQNNLKVWRDMQEQFFKAADFTLHSTAKSKENSTPPPDGGGNKSTK